MPDSLSSRPPQPLRAGRTVLVGLAAAAGWIGLWTFFIRGTANLGGPASMVSLGLPLAFIALAVFLAMALSNLRQQAQELRTEIEQIRAAQIVGQTPAEQAGYPTLPVAAAPEPSAPVASDIPVSDEAFAEPSVQFTSKRHVQPAQVQTAIATEDAQGSLALKSDPLPPPLQMADLIRALHFPETAEDVEGFRAMRRALRDHRAGQVIQASQDVLTLLSQSGIYMDDLAPDRAHPELWRRFAQGERGGAMSPVGGVRDADLLDTCGTRMREDAVFRDVAHHFLRRFDRLLAEIEPDLSDQDLAYLTDTRTARAFMLLGRTIGLFD